MPYSAQPLRASESTAPPTPTPSCTQLHRLTDRELIAELLNNTNIAPGVLADQWPDSLMAIAHLDQFALSTALGLAPDTARRLAAALELHHRLVLWQVPKRVRITQPEDALPILAPLCTFPEEHLWCIALNVRNGVIGAPREVTKGDVDGTDAGPRAFYRMALQCGAVSAIVVHNHPSGNPDPSEADVAVTQRLVTAGRAVDIKLVDSLIITADRGRWTSLRRDRPECFR